MATRDNYLAQYYERATIDQLVAEYKLKGYYVQRGVKLDKYRIDMLAEKDGYSIFFEIVSKRMDVKSRCRIDNIRNLIQCKPNSRLIVVPVRYSEEKQIVFNNVENLLFNHFIEEIPHQLDELSIHTKLESVDYVNIESIRILEHDIVMKGSGQVTVELQSGREGNQDGDNVRKMSFPFEFDGTASWKDSIKDYVISELDELQINTDEFYH